MGLELLSTVVYKSFEYLFPILFDIHLGVALLGHTITLCVTFKELPDCFPQGLHPPPFAIVHSSHFKTTRPLQQASEIPESDGGDIGRV